MPLPFLDTNVILRHLLADDPKQSPRATAFLMQVEEGSVRVRTADTVVFEAVFTLERRYRLAKAQISEALLPLLQLSGIVLPGKRQYEDVFALYVDLDLPFADAYDAVLAKRAEEPQVVSFDRHFDRIPGITRIEP
jgi:uncharacterized protein